MDSNRVITAPETKQPLPSGAVVLFLLAVAGITALIVIGHLVVWNLEQLAIADESMAQFAEAGKIWFIAQALLIGILAGIAVAVSKSAFKPVYRSWLIGALITLPALVLKFLGPNQDQVGAGMQILLALLGAGVVLAFNRKAVTFDGRAWFGLTVAALGIWPFLLWGALGSGTDTLLNLGAGLAFGLLAASLVAITERHYLLDGLGIGVLLAILGSALGYDGGQLLLLLVLPAFGFALTHVASSLFATTLTVGLLAAAPLVFIDPTELTIVLGDLLPWAIKASLLMTTLGLLIGLVAWLGMRKRTESGGASLSGFPVFPPVVAWSIAIALYGFLGLHGFSGDRLFVIMKDQADLSGAVGLHDRNQRLTYVYKSLTEEANTSQADLRQTLDRFRIHYQPYYLVNAIEVDGSALVRLYMLGRPDVDRVIPSPRLRPIPPSNNSLQGTATHIFENPGWNIKMIGADRVWSEFGVKGKGVVVGQSDSGADGKHPALADSYRGATTGNDYNWYDPWTNTEAPNDGEGHGTHTLGIVLGKGGIGVAPEAQWIGCVNLERNLGNPPLYLSCMQFMLAPFPRNGDPLKDGDPTRAAYVLNNSWGCPTIEGCDAEVATALAVDALRKAGIFVAASAGNDGPLCGTLSNPPAIYDSAFSVAAVDRLGQVATFSSRGPVTIDGSNRVKPDIAAPGVDVVSSLPGGTYGPESGTSMAGPHLAGVVALLWSANPALIGDIDRTEQILIQTAKPYTGSRPDSECFSGTNPSDAYGYGIVDAYAAVKMALGK